MCDPAVPETLLFVGEMAVFSRWYNLNLEREKKNERKVRVAKYWNEKKDNQYSKVLLTHRSGKTSPA